MKHIENSSLKHFYFTQRNFWDHWKLSWELRQNLGKVVLPKNFGKSVCSLGFIKAWVILSLPERENGLKQEMYFGRDHETDFVLTSRVSAEFEYVIFFFVVSTYSCCCGSFYETVFLAVVIFARSSLEVQSTSIFITSTWSMTNCCYLMRLCFRKYTCTVLMSMLEVKC